MCTIANGLDKNCTYQTAGNSVNLYLGNVSGTGAIAIGTTGTGAVTSLTGDFYRVQVSNDSLIDTSNMIVGASKNRFFEHKVAFKVADSTNESRAFFEDLGNSRLVAVVEDRNGQFKVYGSSQIGLETTVMNFTGGGAAADEYGYSVEMMENYPFAHRYTEGLEVSGTGGVYTFA